MRKALAITLTRVPASSCSWISSRAALVSFEGIATPRKTLNTTGKCRDRRLEGKDTLNMLHIDKNNDLHTKNGCRALEQAMFDILRVRGGPGVFFPTSWPTLANAPLVAGYRQHPPRRFLFSSSTSAPGLAFLASLGCHRVHLCCE